MIFWGRAPLKINHVSDGAVFYITKPTDKIIRTDFIERFPQHEIEVDSLAERSGDKHAQKWPGTISRRPL